MNNFDNFYCAKEAGTNFSIIEWNSRNKLANDMGLSDIERRKFIGWGIKCKTQCTECACIVGEQRLKTKKLIEQQKSKSS